MYLNDRQTQYYRTQIETVAKELLGIKAVCEIKNMPNEYGITFVIRDTNDLKGPAVAQFSVSHMPGCCGIIVSHGTIVNNKYANKKLASELHKIKIDLAKALNFSSMICTDIASISHSIQRKILDKNEWQEVAKFNNLNSGNDVAVFFKNLRVNLTKE